MVQDVPGVTVSESIEDFINYFSQNLSNSVSFDLLDIPIPEINSKEALNLSCLSKQFEQARKYVSKVIAARTCEMQRFYRGDAAFDYDIAAKAAEFLGLIEAAIRCRIRACKIYSELGREEERDFAASHIAAMAERYTAQEMEHGITKRLKREAPQKPDLKNIRNSPHYNPRIAKTIRHHLSDESLDTIFNGNKL